MEIQPDQLIPGERYFLKWGVSGPTVIGSFVILECEFIKHYDNRFINERIQLRLRRILSASLVENNITTDQGEIIPRDFDDPLFPYKSDRFFYKPDIKGIGLFRIIRLVSTAEKGIVSNEAQGFKNNRYDQNPYLPNFINKNTKINTGYNIIMGETLIWVNLSRVKIIKKPIDKQKLYEDKTADTLFSINTTLKGDFTSQSVKPFLGGRKRKSRKTRKEKKNSKRKGKSRIFKRKTIKH